MANSTGRMPESYPAEHFIGKPGCPCEPCRAWFDGWSAGHAAGRNDERATADRKHNRVSTLRSIVSESHAAGDRKTLGEALDALCALAGNENALMTAGARKFLVSGGRCVKCGEKIGLNEQDHLSTCDKCIGGFPPCEVVGCSEHPPECIGCGGPAPCDCDEAGE